MFLFNLYYEYSCYDMELLEILLLLTPFIIDARVTIIDITIAFPCDSPAVRKRSIQGSF